jgi:hypothetical protein
MLDKGEYGRGRGYSQDCAGDHPPPAPDDFQIVLEMDFLFQVGVRRQNRIGGVSAHNMY